MPLTTRAASSLSAILSPSLRRSALLLVWTVGALAAAVGCSDWDKYWSPSGPEPPPPDTTPPIVIVQTPSGSDSTEATPVTRQSTIVVDAQDESGIDRIVVHIDGAREIELTSPPWEFPWDTTTLQEASIHRVWATATDGSDRANTSVSDTVYAQVFNLGPELVIASPPSNARVAGEVEIAVEFLGAVPELDSLVVQAGLWKIATLTEPPWSVTFDSVILPAGVHYLQASAYTALGYLGISNPPVPIYVNNGIPTVSISFPPEGFRVASRGTLILEASAFDDEEGPIPDERIVWRAGALEIGTGQKLGAANLPAGTPTITVIATNAWGTPDSATVDVEVLAEPTYNYCDNIQWELLEVYFCTFCHDPATSEYPSSELDLRSYAALMAGGKTEIYECVSPCKPESSLVYNKITSETPWIGDQMPPFPEIFPRVPPFVAEQLYTWILEGAPPDDPENCQ